MRTLRWSLVGTIILALLGGPAATATAQDGADDLARDSAMLDFSVAGHGAWTTGKRPSVEGGRNRYRDFRRYIDLVDTGDSRLRGQLWLTQNHDVFHDTRGSVAVGLAGIDLEDGTWRGDFRGYGRPGYDFFRLRIDLTGEGAYEGLSAMLFVDQVWERDPSDRGSFEFEGIVFPGAVPPMPMPSVE